MTIHETHPANTWQRKLLAIAAVGLLSVPSAIGVQRALAPTRGEVAAWLAAAGFEAVYISTAILVLSTELRRYAQRVALAAVAVAVALNTIADYSTRVPGGLANWPHFVASFDPLALGLSLVESLPLAALSYAMATLLHRLSEGQPQDASAPASAEGTTVELPDVAWAREASPATFVPGDAVRDDAPHASLIGDPGIDGYACERCGAALPDHGAWMRMRRWGGCEHCSPREREPEPEPEPEPRQTCPRCGAHIPDPARWRAARRWGRCGACKEG